jgi:hypothetical protein
MRIRVHCPQFGLPHRSRLDNDAVSDSYCLRYKSLASAVGMWPWEIRVSVEALRSSSESAAKWQAGRTPN